MQWWGGKSPLDSAGPGRWIAGLLPVEGLTTYVEPFMGMLGILLQRPPAAREFASDIDAELVNWWLTVQARGPDLADRIAATTPSRDVYEEQCARYRQPGSAMDRAWAFTVVHWLGQAGQPGIYKGDHRPLYAHPRAERIRAASRRVQHVEIAQRHAAGVIEQHRGDPGALIYCDPPFAGTTTSKYAAATMHDTDIAPAGEAHMVLSTRAEQPGWPHCYTRTGAGKRGFMARSRSVVEYLYSTRPLHTGTLFG